MPTLLIVYISAVLGVLTLVSVGIAFNSYENRSPYKADPWPRVVSRVLAGGVGRVVAIFAILAALGLFFHWLGIVLGVSH